MPQADGSKEGKRTEEGQGIGAPFAFSRPAQTAMNLEWKSTALPVASC
jgi:hypothetical protein